VKRGGLITVTWTAPQGQTSPYDWIGLFKTTDPNESFDPSRWIYTNGAPTGSTTFTAPATLGTYNARYLLNDGYTDVTRSSPVKVRQR
jgi:hypothetical protein